MEAVENMSLEALQEQIQKLEKTLAELSAKVAQLAPAAPPKPAPEPLPEPAAPVVEEGVSEEILLVLSAAIAAYVGKRFRIRSARLMPSTGSSPWAQQGRVSIQASHMLLRH